MTPRVLVTSALLAFLCAAPGRSEEPAPAARIHAVFAEIPDFAPPAGDLELFRFTVPGEKAAALRSALNRCRTEFHMQRKEVEALREQTQRQAREMLLAAVSCLRTRGTWWLEKKFSASIAQDNFVEERWEWLYGLWELHSAEKELRRIAEEYYFSYAVHVFAAQEPARREEVLRWCEQRMQALRKERLKTFTTIEKDRSTFLEGFWTKASEQPPGQEKEEPDLPTKARATLDSAALQRNYAWLVPETAVHAAVYGQLLAKHELAVQNSELHPLVLRAVASDRAYRPGRPLPGDTGGVRLRLVRIRARRAQVTQYRKEAELEAAHRSKVSVLLGIGGALENASRKGWQVMTDGVVGRKSLKGLEPQTQLVAMLAVTHKLLGGLFSTLVTTPLMDTCTDLLSPVFKAVSGVKLKNSVQKALDEHGQLQKEADARIELLGQIAETYTLGQCRQHVEFLRDDTQGNGQGAGRLADSPPTTVRGLLLDTDFIAGSGGGLPHVFEPLCEDPTQLGAVLLHGALYEIRADFEVAARRLAAARGVSLEDADFESTRKLLDKLPGPVDPVTGRRTLHADRSVFLMAIPVVGVLWNLPRDLINAIEFLKGTTQDEDAYLKELGGHKEKLLFVLMSLEDCGYDYDQLSARFPAVYRLHLQLLARSHEYASAYRWLAAAQSESYKLWRSARHFDPDTGALTRRGQDLVIALQQATDLEQTALAVHAAQLKLRYFALTRDYSAAAEQTLELVGLERLRRIAHRIQPIEVDLSAAAAGFRREALRGELIATYEELYYTAAKAVVLSVAGSALKDAYLGKVAPAGAAAGEAAGEYVFPWDDVGKRLWGAYNPWAGKFTADGVLEVMNGAVEDGVKNGFAQVLAKKQTLFDEGQIENALDIVWSVTEDLRTEMRADAVDAVDLVANWFVQREEADHRQTQIAETAGKLRSYTAEELTPLREELARLARTPENNTRRAELIEEIDRRDTSPDVQALRSELKALACDQAGAEVRAHEAEEEAAEVTAIIGSELARSNSFAKLRRLSDEDLGDAQKIEALAAEDAAGGYARTLARGHVTLEDLARLTDPKDPLGLERSVLRDGPGLGTLRRAVARAIDADPERAAEIHVIETELARRRVRRVDELLDEFRSAGGPGDSIVRAETEGAREDDPEFGGLREELGVHIVVKRKADEEKVADALRKFLEDNGVAVGDADALVAGLRVHGLDRFKGEGPEGARPPPLGVPSEWLPSRRLPDDNLGKRDPRRLEPDLAQQIESKQGFHRDHAEAMHVYAQRTATFLVVRDGNPESVPYFNDPDAVPKSMDCKAKTMKVGTYAGLVVDPTHEVQSRIWTEELQKAVGTDGYDKLAEARLKALDTWAHYKQEMLETHKYKVDEQTGLVLKPVVDNDGATVYRKVHGDYDLHGVYRLMGDDKLSKVKVGFGTGSVDSNRRHALLREQLNEFLGGRGGKKFIQHGSQDDWDHAGKKPDPPVTVFFPDGRPPARLETAADMRRFYEHELKIKWEYPDETESERAPPAAAAPRRTGLGRDTFDSPGAARWVANLHRFRGATLLGEPDRVFRPVERGEAHALILDMARQLSVLSDPRVTRAEITALPTTSERIHRLDEVIAQTGRFLQLVDAHLIANPRGNELYGKRAAQRGSGYFGAMLRDAESLAGGGGLAGFREADLEKLRVLVAMQARNRHPDAWNVPGVGGRNDEGVAEVQALFDWMGEKSLDIVAQSAVLWRETHDLVGRDATPGERSRHMDRLAAAVRIAEQAQGGAGTALLKAPVVLDGVGGATVLSVAEHRRALQQALERARETRAILARQQAGVRAELVQRFAGAALEEPQRNEVKKKITDALRDPSGAPTGGRDASDWVRYADLVGARLKRE